MAHPAALDAAELQSQCDVRFVRRSGPGGQHRNKVSTGVVLRHRPTGLEAEANERRSQAENRAVAVRRLRLNLALRIRLPWPAERTPSALWRSRCAGGRINISLRHDAFPALLAEALDALAAADHESRAAAERLSCTPSQLVKLLKKEPRAVALVNHARAAAGLPALK